MQLDAIALLYICTFVFHKRIKKSAMLGRYREMNIDIPLFAFGIKRPLNKVFFKRRALIIPVSVEFQCALWHVSVVQPLFAKQGGNNFLIFFLREQRWDFFPIILFADFV